jgi:dipeptidyl aminopeptidase/acylaminoacyl peptidase
MRLTKSEIANQCLLAFLTLLFLGPVAAANVEDYAKFDDFGNATLSPDGKYIAVDRPGDIRSTLLIVDAATLKPLTEFSLPPHQSVYGAQWANNDTLVFGRTQRTGGLETPRSYGEVIAMSVDGKRTKYLYGAIGDTSNRRSQQDTGWAQVINTLQNDDQNIIILQTDWDNADKLKTKPAIIKVNVYTGKRDQLAISPINNPYVTFDLENRLRFVTGYDENFYPASYRYFADSNSWEKIPGNGSKFYSFLPLQFLPGNKDLLAKISEAGEANCLYLVKQDNSKEKLHCEDGGDIGSLMKSSQPGLPLAVLSNPTNPVITMLSGDNDDSRLYQAVSKSFPDDIVYFENFSKDGTVVLFSVYSDIKPRRYYLYNKTSNTSKLVFSSKAKIDITLSGNTTGFNFKARDGLTIHGLLTLPKNHVKGKTPMVVMPHGGPLGISDEWAFDSDVQWLAANGYAVLRVNFRGSDGYGEAFIRKGYKTWGTDIQHDIIDATNFVIGTRTVDKDNVCITGGSFGAYSAMMSSILAPQTFRCTIGYAGVYDLSLFLKSGDITDSLTGLRYLDLVLGKDKAALAAQSAVSRANELKIPVLLIHGSNDYRTPLPQALRLEKALKDAGNVPEMLIAQNEGHGFVREKNRILYLTSLKAFLDKHIGPKKAASK